MRMVRRKRCGKIPLAVGVVCRMESLLIKISRKRRLTTEDRQNLLKHVMYLRKKRQRHVKGKIIIPSRIWLKTLHFLAVLVKSHEHVRKIFDVIFGDR